MIKKHLLYNGMSCICLLDEEIPLHLDTHYLHNYILKERESFLSDWFAYTHRKEFRQLFLLNRNDITWRVIWRTQNSSDQQILHTSLTELRFTKTVSNLSIGTPGFLFRFAQDQLIWDFHILLAKHYCLCPFVFIYMYLHSECLNSHWLPS